ncbi:MAG: hypothetical protein IPM77_17750 [Crocinitomicaceae bacterium]|nr:hypothetical protein [Crocinitomicaceae bacterium]
MAGGKETPRQKMIGMMYLVLTALLALNVSKQIVAAFITINDKIDRSSASIDEQLQSTYARLDQKGATLRAENRDLTNYNFWNSNALALKKSSAEIVGFLLSECNDMIKEAEGTDWVEQVDAEGNIIKLKSLQGIQNMDNYDIPTNMFVGGNPENPNDRGKQLVEKIHAYRNQISELLANYSDGNKKWIFKAPENPAELSSALITANPKDTTTISRLYKSLTLPERLYSLGEETELPWVSATFDHAPIVAAAAMFTSLKLDIKNAQVLSAEYMLSKIDVIPFVFNKIEPMPYAASGYINQGDSLNLRVMIAAFDSNEVATIRYGIDADSANRNNWKETKGGISLDGLQPGQHRVKGEIGIRERGEMTWKPWEFSYTVGQPMGVIAQPEMRVLYWGYDNVIESAASGYPADKIKLSATNCSLRSNGNGKYFVDVSRGTRSASIGIQGIKDDGSSVSLGQFNFNCKPLPGATLYFGSVENGGTMTLTEARNTTKIRVGLDPSIPLTNVTYAIIDGTLRVGELPGQGTISSNGDLDQRAKTLMAQSAGKSVVIEVKYRDKAGITKIETLSFKVRA